MKRLLIRMSVLAVVVVLGWIAIAQAQRGTADSSPTSDATPSLPVDEGAPAPILAPVARGYSTPSGSADSGVNPLRAKRLSFNDLASAPAAGATGATNSAVAGAAVQPRPQTATVSFGQTSDPFARPADATNPVRATNATILPTAATSSAAKSAAIAEVSAGENLPSLTSAASTPSAQPAGSDSTSPTVPANSNSSGNAASQGGAALSKEPALGTASEATAQSASRGVSPPARAGEPAPFKLDPTASNGSLPLRGPSADRAAPGATPSQGASAVPDASASFGTGKPGARQLEGPQSPSLTVQKLGPAETQVGKAATF